MGNNISSNNIYQMDTCLICWENINTQQFCICIRCNIILHNLCEEKYRGEKNYTECPHCRRVGTIGSYK